MGERKGVNKYYPPDFDPSKGSLNSWLGTHPLRDRARKLHKGILVIRFEMPYNIWCGGCNNHIGMGVRYNAEKSKVGSYYTTPIYKFRMKCHLCDNHFEIQTDPKNHDYVILEGARRKEQRWDPKENEQIVPEDKATQKKLATDPMYKLEHGSDDKERGKSTNVSVAHIEDMRLSWRDDYALNQIARGKFRKEKKQLAESRAADQALLTKASLDIELLPEDERDKQAASLLKYSVTKSFEQKQQEKRRAIENRPFFQQPSATCSLLPRQKGGFSRRAQIKHKLGLHLSSPRVQHALTGSATLKGLVKNSKAQTTKNKTTTESSQSDDVSNNVLDANDVSGDKTQEDVPEASTPENNAEKDLNRATLSEGNSHGERTSQDSGKELRSGQGKAENSDDTEICSKEDRMKIVNGKGNKIDEGKTYVPLECKEEPDSNASVADTSGLAALMASYTESDASNSDSD